MPTGPKLGLARLGQRRRQRLPDLGEEHRVHVYGVVHSHAVGTDDAAVVLVGETNNLLLTLTD